MEHVTEEAVGKPVVTPGGDEIGRVNAVENDRAVVKPYTGVEADMADSAAPEEESLTLDANQIELVTDDYVQLVDEFRREG
ncbi:hypothetical protein [Haloprofundus salinisoli]|uniref:hypothetical protein n=1 Tax=Haloprofundus salinisoli TaxID=2876193 RepID=UPI001CCB5C94|nr:hypothetical protein [Haloprofundus salinisoli]